jgi:hypothetical protein
MTTSGETPGRIVLRVEVETKEGQLKQGTAGQFTVMCDEGPHLEGNGATAVALLPACDRVLTVDTGLAVRGDTGSTGKRRKG